jgi:hypothetical protein
MALFAFRCPAGHFSKRLLPEATPEVVCRVCGALASRKRVGAYASVYETIDNGLQAKATVRPADAERMFKEDEIANDLANADAPIDDADLERVDDIGELL